MLSSSADRSARLHRVLRPTAHTSAKPQYVPAPELRRRYTCVRDLGEAERLWAEAYEAEESSRVQACRPCIWILFPLMSRALAQCFRLLTLALDARRFTTRRRCSCYAGRCCLSGRRF